MSRRMTPQRRYKRRFNLLQQVIANPSSSAEERASAVSDVAGMVDELIERLPRPENRVQVLKEPRVPRRS